MTDVFITSYALNVGKIYKYTISEEIPANGWVKVGNYSYKFRLGENLFLTEEEARMNVEKQREEKRGSLQRKLNHLKNLEVYVKEKK